MRFLSTRSVRYIKPQLHLEFLVRITMTTAIQEWSRAQIRARFVKTKGPMTVAESVSILQGWKYNLLLLGSDNREYAREIHFRDNTFYFQNYAEYKKYVKEHP